MLTSLEFQSVRFKCLYISSLLLHSHHQINISYHSITQAERFIFSLFPPVTQNWNETMLTCLPFNQECNISSLVHISVHISDAALRH